MYIVESKKIIGLQLLFSKV